MYPWFGQNPIFKYQPIKTNKPYSTSKAKVDFGASVYSHKE